MKMHQLDGYIQKIYLVEYDHGLMLLDGCCRADVSLISEYINDTLGRPLSDLKLVVVTHMHPDHAGAAHKLRQISGCKIASGAQTRPWYRGLSGLMMFVTDIILTWWVAGRIGRPRKNILYSPVLKPDVMLRDGDRLADFDEWQVIDTPGHTDRDISVWHLPSGRVYVADLMVKVKGRYCPPFPVFHPNKYRQSLQKIRQMSPAAMWLAHVGEVTLSEAEFDHLQTIAPTRPKTHWRATKARIAHLMIRTSGR